MADLIEKANNYILENKMLSGVDRVVVGLSGGADSVCLLMVMNKLREKYGLAQGGVVAVHVNHGIRGAEADDDQCFVEALCKEFEIECVSYYRNIPEYARKHSLTVEEAGRRYRYECFEETLRMKGATKIAVAHNKNDFAETVLFNLIRGTGLKGLAGIPSVRGNIIRPLLFATRDEIELYLKQCNQDFRIDSSNNQTDYDRNRIRHIILPEMLEINSGAVEHICQAAEVVRENYQYVEGLVSEKLDRLIEHYGNSDEISISITVLLNEELPIRRQLIHELLGRACGNKKDITAKHICAVEELLSQQTGKQLQLPYGLKVRVSYDKLLLSKEGNKSDDYCYEISDEAEITLPSGDRLCVNCFMADSSYNIPKNNYTKVIDYDKIKDTLCLRNVQDGDYIIINKQGESKKLNRLFIDNKVDRQLRNSWPVVAVGHEIVWAIDLRYNEAYRVDDNTSRVMCLEYKRKEEKNG